MRTSTVGRWGAVALVAATVALSGCTPTEGTAGTALPRSSVAGTPAPSASADPALPDGLLGTAELRTPDGVALGTLTITADAGRVTLSYPAAAPGRADSLRLTPFGGGECADTGFAWSLPFDAPGAGVHLSIPADDFATLGDPTVFRTALLSRTRTDGADCLLDVAGSGELRWMVAPRGLSAPIADTGAQTHARGAATATVYTPAAGDTPTGVAHRLGITVADLEWLNPPHLELRAAVPVNLSPDRRGLPLPIGG